MLLTPIYYKLLDEDVIELDDIALKSIFQEAQYTHKHLMNSDIQNVWKNKKEKILEKLKKKKWKFVTNIDKKVKDMVTTRNERYKVHDMKIIARTFDGKVIMLNFNTKSNTYLSIIDFLCTDEKGKFHVLSMSIPNTEGKEHSKAVTKQQKKDEYKYTQDKMTDFDVKINKYK